MILTLFGFFLFLSLVLIIMGFVFKDHTELTLIGYLFMFLLSFVVIGGNLEYKTGSTETYSYSSLCCDGTRVSNSSLVCASNSTNLVVDQKNVIESYQKYDDNNTHYFGYYLALISGLGFAITIWSIKQRSY